MPILKRLFRFNEPEDNLRIIITRHGERADQVLGIGWVSKMQKSGGYDRRIPTLTHRSNFREWNFDSPLTVAGEMQSASVGQKLLHLGFPIDYCYSSPAYRSIQTANKILESQGRKSVPINIEPGLFECPAWYHGKPLTFISPEHLAMDRKFNIDPYYSPIYDGVDPYEDERKYYQRSRYVIDEIVRAHKYQGGTVLLSAHGGSIEALTRALRGLFHRRGRPEHLIQEAMRVEYCNFTILERDARTGEWTIQIPESHHHHYHNSPVELSKYALIPLYGITKEHLVSDGRSSYLATRRRLSRKAYYPRFNYY